MVSCLLPGGVPKHCPRRQLQMGEDSHQAKHDGEPINFINLLPKYPSLTRNTARNAARALSRAARALPGYVFARPRGHAPLTRQCGCIDHLVDVFQLWASFALCWSLALGTFLVPCLRSPLVWHALARNLCNSLRALFFVLRGQGSKLFTCYVSLVSPRGFEDGRRQSADATMRLFQVHWWCW